MQTPIKYNDSAIVEEPQLDIMFSKAKSFVKEEVESEQKVLNVLSLFSGCGGMDLGFEGNFAVLEQSINKTLTPHFIKKKLDNGFVQLKKQDLKQSLPMIF